MEPAERIVKLAGEYTLAFREERRKDGRKEKVEKKLAAPICVCKSTVFFFEVKPTNLSRVYF